MGDLWATVTSGNNNVGMDFTCMHDDVNGPDARNGSGFVQNGGKFLPEAGDLNVQLERFHGTARSIL